MVAFERGGEGTRKVAISVCMPGFFIGRKKNIGTHREMRNFGNFGSNLNKFKKFKNFLTELH
jgi:hypothetical protein